MQAVLGIYSGMPDPAWALSPQQTSELAGALSALMTVDEPVPSSGLG